MTDDLDAAPPPLEPPSFQWRLKSVEDPVLCRVKIAEDRASAMVQMLVPVQTTMTVPDWEERAHNSALNLMHSIGLMPVSSLMVTSEKYVFDKADWPEEIRDLSGLVMMTQAMEGSCLQVSVEGMLGLAL